MDIPKNIYKFCKRSRSSLTVVDLMLIIWAQEEELSEEGIKRYNKLKNRILEQYDGQVDRKSVWKMWTYHNRVFHNILNKCVAWAFVICHNNHDKEHYGDALLFEVEKTLRKYINEGKITEYIARDFKKSIIKRYKERIEKSKDVLDAMDKWVIYGL